DGVEVFPGARSGHAARHRSSVRPGTMLVVVPRWGYTVVVGSAAVKPAVGRDPTHYPVVDKIGEGSLQRFIVALLRPLLANVLVERGVKAFVGADQFIYYEQYAPTYVVAPDVYVIPGFDAGLAVDCWKTWEHGAVPSFALEIVS